MLEGLGMTGHLQQDIYALPLRGLHDFPHHVRFLRVEDGGGPRLTRLFDAEGLDLGGEDRRGSRRTGDADGQQADHPAAGDQYRPGRQLRGEGRVHGIAKGILDGGPFHGHVRRVQPGVLRGEGQIFGETAVAIHSDNGDVLADVRPAGAALGADTAHDVTFGGDEIPGHHRRNLRAHLDHLAAELVAGDDRRLDTALRPGIPVPDMQIGAADGGRPDLDQHITRPHGGDVHPLHLQSGPRLRFDHGSHLVCHFECSPLRECQMSKSECQNPDGTLFGLLKFVI